MPPTDAPVVYIAGDVHLTGDGGPFMAWLDRLATRPAARLVILGDLFEYWIDTDESVQRYLGVFQRLRALRHLGWRIDLVLGNREMVSGRRLVAAVGVPVHWPSLVVPLGPRRIRVVHGDRLCGEVGHRALTALLRCFCFRAWQACHPDAVQDLVARWIRRASKAGQRRRRAGRRHPRIHPLWLLGAMRGVDAVVAGHIHLQRHWRLSGAELLLVGDWPPEGGHWVEGHADGRLVLKP